MSPKNHSAAIWSQPVYMRMLCKQWALAFSGIRKVTLKYCLLEKACKLNEAFWKRVMFGFVSRLGFFFLFFFLFHNDITCLRHSLQLSEHICLPATQREHQREAEDHPGHQGCLLPWILSNLNMAAFPHLDACVKWQSHQCTWSPWVTLWGNDLATLLVSKKKRRKKKKKKFL